MKIIKKQIRYNVTPLAGRKIEYIVIHDTGNRSKGANAESHYRYFDSADRDSSADIFIDDSEVYIVNDYKNKFCWSVGDGQNKYGINNRNSVSIELCINSDGNYEKAFNNLIQFTKKLMKELNIPANRVVRHYDASRKNCPQTMNVNSWGKWFEFKNRIGGIGDNTPTGVYKKGSKGEEVKWIQNQLNKYGYNLIVDGDFGNNTENAVKDFQRNHGLTVDGVVGQNTISKLKG